MVPSVTIQWYSVCSSLFIVNLPVEHSQHRSTKLLKSLGVIQTPLSTQARTVLPACPNKLIRWLVGALSPVSHKGLFQGWKQTSVYLLVLHSTSHQTTSVLFSNHNSNYIHNFGTQTQKNNSTCFETYLNSTGTQNGNLHQLSVTMSWLTYFILHVHTGIDVRHSQHRTNSGEVNGPEG